MRVPLKKIALHVILPLFIGLIIYIVARPRNWLVHELLPFSFDQKKWNPQSAGWLMRVVVFNGPDFCWDYSISAALLFWKYFYGSKGPHLLVFIFMLLLVQELAQFLFATYFTFDVMDIVAAVVAFLLSLFLNRKYV